MSRPKLFIASSRESLPIAEAVNLNLDHDFEVTLWRGGTFKLSSVVVEDLLNKSASVDFALFVFAPEDIALIRQSASYVTRDNVVFELGLFVGSLGKDRCFILRPRNTDLRLPSDLAGLIFADFDAERDDGDLVSATNAACSQIKSRAAELGIRSNKSKYISGIAKNCPKEYRLNDLDVLLLAACSETRVSDSQALDIRQIKARMNFECQDGVLNLSVIKLERLNLLEKVILPETNHSNDFYGYLLTDQGVDVLLENQERLTAFLKGEDGIPF